MSQRLYVRKGGGASTAVEVTDHVAMGVRRKGAPIFENGTPIIQMGRRAADGEASQGEFRLVDPEAEIHSDDYRLSPHALVTWTEDASGDELWLARGRIAPLESGRRGFGVAADEVEWQVTVNDNNMDLRGQAFTENWVRPSETDLARIHALRDYTLNGSSSTAPHARTSCNPVIDHDVNGHLVATAFDRVMPARTYPAGTQPQDVIAECAERSGKTYGLVIHHTGGSSHDCLLYIGALDHATYVSTVKVSDHLDEADIDNPTAPVFPPVWDRGKGTLTENDGVVSGVVVIYAGTNEEPESVFVHDPADEAPYEYWVDAINDDKVDTVEEAQNLAQTYFTSHRAPGHRTHRFSIKMHASQHHLINAGMSIEVKSAVIAGGANLDTYVWRRITELRWEPDPDPEWIWARIDLEKPLRRRGLGLQPSATTPRPPTPPATASCDADISSLTLMGPIPNGGFETGASTGWTINQISGSVQGPVSGTHEGSYFYEINGAGYAYHLLTGLGPFLAGETYVARLRVADAGGATTLRFGRDYGGLTGDVGVVTVDTGAGGDFVDFCVEWTPAVDCNGSDAAIMVAVHSGLDNFAFDDARVYSGSSGTSTGASVGTVGGTGEGSASTTTQTYIPTGSVLEHSNITTGGPYHEAADVTYDNGSSGLTADDVQEAIDELVAGATVITEITDLPTAETDTDLVLHPDGAGGVEWGVDDTGAGGGGGGGSGNIVRIHDAAGDFTTSSTTLVAVSTTRARLTITLAAPAYVQIGVTGGFAYNGAAEVGFGLQIDGVEQGGSEGLYFGQVNNISFNSRWLGFTYMSDVLGSGAHDIDLTYNGGGATLTLNANSSVPLHMWAMEAGPGPDTDTLADLVVADGAVHYWRLNDVSGNPQDSIGTNHASSVTGALGYGDTGATGDGDDAIAFDGNDYATIGYGSIPVGTNAWSIECLYKGTSTSKQTIISYGSDSTRQSMFFVLNDGGNPRIGVASWSDDQNVTATGLLDGNYHHIVLTHAATSATVKVYMDGALLGTLTYGGNLNIGTAGGVQIGTNRFDPTQHRLNGTLDELAIYPTELSSTQVSDHFDAIGNA